MNLSKNPTKDELLRLLSRCDDSADHHQTWVMPDGTVHIEPSGQARFSGAKFRLEAFVAGNGYVGPEAAKDDKWVERLFNGLVKAWADDRKGFLDVW